MPTQWVEYAKNYIRGLPIETEVADAAQEAILSIVKTKANATAQKVALFLTSLRASSAKRMVTPEVEKLRENQTLLQQQQEKRDALEKQRAKLQKQMDEIQVD